MKNLILRIIFGKRYLEIFQRLDHLEEVMTRISLAQLGEDPFTKKPIRKKIKV